MDYLWLLLLAIAAAAGVTMWVRRSGRPAPPALPAEPGDDLRALGLSPARPRSADAPDPNARRPALPRAETPPAPAGPHAVLRDGTFARHDAVEPLLTAFATALDGPVAVLTVGDGVASVDALADAVPTGSPLRLPQRRLSAASTAELQRQADAAFGVGEAATDALRAFRAAGADAPDAAAARALSGERIVVAGGALDADALALADRFADLLDALDPAPPAPDAAPEPAVAPEAPATDDALADDDAPAADAHLDVTETPVESEPELVPRIETPSADAPEPRAAEPAHAEPAGDAHGAARPVRAARPISRTALLAGEIASSREAGQPLAFALVTHADAEAALADGDPEAATAALAAALRTHDAARRVEPFGDLVAGVFLDADALVAVRWTRTLADHEPPLHVGLVAPADYDAAEVRADAMRALQEAWTAGELVVQAD